MTYKNGLEAAMNDDQKQVKTSPSRYMPAGSMKHIDLTKYNHRMDCPCPDCKDCPGDM